MHLKTGFKLGALIAILGMGLAVAACSSTVSQADYDALKKQLSDQQSQNASLQQQIQAFKSKSANQVTILGAISNAPPPTTPPAPPAAAPPVPDSAKGPFPYSFYVDTVTASPGESSFHVDPTLACAQTNVFRRGMRIVWRFTVTDDATGQRLTSTDVDQAIVKLATGQEVKATFEPAGPPNVPDAWFWHAAWDVPMNYPLGTVDYTIQVQTKSGKLATFKQLPVPPAQLQITG
ncbi:MAG: hypothetical protein M1482_16350 [Chloroflexi bacterium]|nr:hypothetical protein [Chloroflexota bacterium]